MSRRTRSSYVSSYSSYERQENRRRIPSVLPYLLVALLAGAGLLYYQFFTYRSLSGKITNAYTHAPVAGAFVTLKAGSIQPGAQVSPSIAYTSTTTSDGTFLFPRIPPNPMLVAEAPGFAPAEVDATGKRDVSLDLTPNELSGFVTGTDGKPVAAALVAGAARTSSGTDGKYLLKDIPSNRKLVVKAPGYLATTVEFGQVMTQNITLEPFSARAIYLNADTVASPGKLGALLDLIDRTELNAVVIDVKGDNSGSVLYDSKSQLIRDLGTINQIIPDLDGLLASLKARKIYAIARLPVFWDQAVTAARPEWALKSKKAPGQVWVDGYGRRWANPYSQDVWNYNIEIAKEVVGRGFNEVQFDNAHFPSDGDLGDIDFGPEGAGKKRVDALKGFLEKAYVELSSLGVYTAIDVFGLTPFVQDDQGIGHSLEDLAPHVDYICPTIYPSDFPDGFLQYPNPSERPGDLVREAMKKASTRALVSTARIRPWLQDFSRKVPYDAPKVRAELDAAEQNGAVGWMLWNFGNVYTEAALKAP